MKRAAPVLLGVLGSAVGLYIASRAVAWSALVTHLRAAHWPWVLGGVGFLAVGYVLRTVRWWLLLQGPARRLPWRRTIGPLLASVAVNNVLPLRAGDVLRTVAFERQLGAPAALVLGSVLLERLLDLSALLLWVGLSWAGQPWPGGARAGLVLVAASGGGLVLALGWPGALRHALERAASVAARRAWPRLAGLARGAADCCASWQAVRTVPQLMTLGLLSLLIWACEGAAFAAAAWAVGHSAPGLTAWGVMALGTLSTLLPSTPGYVGTFEAVTRHAWELTGASPEMALSAALLVHAVLWAPITLVGLGWWAASSRRSVPSPKPQRAAGSCA